ncbi:Sterol 3-beta-glucosyltransferase [Entomortierella lignicola]|nr:Sterol 3-beta-glucosyltransferase [Entomortierella lignicola]
MDNNSTPVSGGSAFLHAFSTAFRASDNDLDSSDGSDDESIESPVVESPDAESSDEESPGAESNAKPRKNPNITNLDAIANQVQETFGYSSAEELLGEYSCWLLCSLLLPGYMYLTTNHVCFYANLPSNTDVIQMEGFFSKKSRKTKTFSKYWFILKNDALSCYTDQSEIYYPLLTIDLKDAISAEPSSKDDFSFYIYTKETKHKFKTDSEITRSDWVKAIQKSVFHSKVNEENVKISVPLSNITAIDVNKTSVVETIGISIKEDGEPNSELFFAYFDNTSQTASELQNQMERFQADGSAHSVNATDLKHFNNTLSNACDSPLRSSTPEPRSSFPSKLNPLRFLHSSDDSSSVQTIYGSESDRDADSGSRKNRVERSSTFSFRDTASRITEKAKDLTTLGSSEDEQSQEYFRKEFSLPEGEALADSYSGHLLRVFPVNGRVYLSDNYICFRGARFKSNTKVILPLEDVIQLENHHGTQFYFHGIVIHTRTDEEIHFEFSSKETRDKVLEALAVRTTPEAQERRKEYHALAAKDSFSASAVLDDPLEPRIMDSLNIQKKAGTLETQGSRPGTKLHKPIHITCLTIGSRGDVQPYIALCKKLMEDGHTCRIATHGDYQKWIEGHGIEFALVGGNPAELIELCVENGMFTVSFIKEGMKKFRGWLDDLLQTAWKACQNTDLLIESPSAMAGIHIAEALEIPYFRAFPFPWTRTRTFPHPFAVPERNLGRGYNYMTFAMIEQIHWKGISGQVNRWRKKTLRLGPTSMERMEADRVPTLYSWSPTLVPAPIDWHSWVHVTGYWILENAEINWTPPPGLEEFIAADPHNKPVYIGFGSMVVADPEGMTKTIVDAVIKAGVRAIITKGWSDKKAGKDKPKQKDGATAVIQNAGESNEKIYPDSVYMLQSVPHDWLFPQLAGAVHHGGAGTTAASLRAGIPTVIKPYFGDQNFWAQRIEDAGVGVWCHDLTVKKLSAALTTITTDEKLIKKAQAMGERIRSEDGVGMAIQYLYHDLIIAEENIQRIKEEKRHRIGHHHLHHHRRHHHAEDAAAVATMGAAGYKAQSAGRSDNREGELSDVSITLQGNRSREFTHQDSIQHSKTMQLRGEQDYGHKRHDSEPLSNRIRASATEPGPDRDIEGKNKSLEELAAEFESLQPERDLNSSGFASIRKVQAAAEEEAEAGDYDGEPNLGGTKELNRGDGNEEYDDDTGAGDRSVHSDDDEEEEVEATGEADSQPIGKKKSKVRRAFRSITSKVKGVKSHILPSEDPHKTVIVEREAIVGQIEAQKGI